MLQRLCHACIDKGYFKAAWAYAARIPSLEDTPGEKAPCHLVVEEVPDILTKLPQCQEAARGRSRIH